MANLSVDDIVAIGKKKGIDMSKYEGKLRQKFSATGVPDDSFGQTAQPTQPVQQPDNGESQVARIIKSLQPTMGQGIVNAMSVAGGGKPLYDPNMANEVVKSGAALKYAMAPYQTDKLKAETANQTAGTNLKEAQAGAVPTGIEEKKALAVKALTDAGVPIPPELGGQSQGSPQLTGEDYMNELQKTNPARANVLKGIGKYQFNLKDAVGRGGYGTRQGLISDIMRTNPDFDEKTYEARQGYQNDISSGGVSKNITALNTAVGHLDSLKNSMEALGNGNIVPLNHVRNFLTTMTGGGQPSAAVANLNAVENEMANVFKQSGATDQEIGAWKQAFSASASPDQQKAVIAKTIELMNSRLEALTGQYHQVMGEEPPADRFIYPQNQKIIQKYQGGDQQGQNQQPQQAGTTKSGNSFRKVA